MNRKGFHSINIHVVMSVTGTVLDAVAGWPGCTTDAKIFANRFETGQLRRVLLGDSGYPLKRWLMTPIGNPQNYQENAYNRLVHNYYLLLHATIISIVNG